MPYSLSNPPDKIRKLPAKKQRQWIHVFNQALDSGDDEGTAHAKAWGVVKKSSCDGQTFGPTENEGSLADAIRNKDLLLSATDVTVARDLVKVAAEISDLNYRMAMEKIHEAIGNR